MNTSLFRNTLLALAALALPHTANAMLIAGWHDFEGNNNNEAADLNAGGFSGNLVKGPLLAPPSGSDTFGSNDKHYGDPTNSNPYLFVGPTSVNDGDLRLIANTHTFTLTKGSGNSTYLSDIFFDASGLGANITVKYQFNADSVVTLGSKPVTTNVANYSDFSFSLLGVPLFSVGDTISFFFTNTGGGGRIDNIAITAIPEPASLVALGLVLGSGLFLRQRPRQFAPSLA